MCNSKFNILICNSFFDPFLALSDCVEEMHQCASAGAGAFAAAVDDVPTTNSANEQNRNNGDEQNNNKTTKKQHLPLNGPPSCSARFCACSIKAVSARLAANPGHTQDDERCVESMQTICLQIIEHSIASHNGAVGGKNLLAAVDENGIKNILISFLWDRLIARDNWSRNYIFLLYLK